MTKTSNYSSFSPLCSNLSDIMSDHNLAALGDAFVNFTYSLALSRTKGCPQGKKVKGSALAEALRRAGLRAHVPSSVGNHVLADAAEAFLVYAWLHKNITLEESVAILEKNKDLVDGLTKLLQTAKKRIKLS